MDVPVRRTGRFWLRNWPLRSKQIVVILVPVLTALILGYLRISTELAKADEFSRTVTQVDLSATVEQLVHDIQGERDVVVSRVAAGKGEDRSAVAGQIDTVNSSIARLRGVSDSIANLDQAVRTRYDKVVAGLGTLDAIRQMAEHTLFPASDTLFVYDSVIGSLLQLNGEITRVSDDRAISEQATRIDAVGNAKEQLAIQNSILRAAARSGSFGPGELARLRSAQAEFTAELTAFQEASDLGSLTRYANTVAGAAVDDRLRLLQNALNQGDAGIPVTINNQELEAAADATLNKMRQVELASLRDLRVTAQQLTATARTNAIRDAVLIIVVLVLALLLMVVVARSLLTPLRVLRRDALDVAHRRLPATVQRILADPDPLTASENAVDPVPVFTTEEVGQVARSFDAVQHQAVRLATEQAAMRDNTNKIFVNLSHRTQGLVQRQLDLIDELEQDEQDPDQLANLFRLDHLATRMRRNSESLLVLSGTGLSHQITGPVSAYEVVEAAKSEVEQYTRIELTTARDVFVQGRVVRELVHLLAELFDNATYFSPPETKVTVGIQVSRRQDLIIQITDTGVGMKEDEIEEANQRLANPPDLEVAVSRRMGLYVVARLAKKHGIVVALRENQDIEGGVVARITVPAGLISLPPMPTTTPTTMLTTATSSTNPAGVSQRPDRTAASSGSIYQAFRRHRLRAGARRTDTSSVTQPVSDGGSTPTVQGDESSPSEVSGNPTGHHNRKAGPVGTTLFADPMAERVVTGFSPSSSGLVPSIPPTGTGAAVGSRVEAPTEWLPIYENVLSQWFSDNTGPSTGIGVRPSPDTHHERPHDDGIAAGRPADTEPWTSAADAGWLAAQAVLASSNDPTRASGLPKRIPRAQLLPGSVPPRQDVLQEHQEPGAGAAHEAVAMGVPQRSADIVRTRMASFQQGIRRGRHALISDPADTNGHHQSERT